MNRHEEIARLTGEIADLTIRRPFKLKKDGGIEWEGKNAEYRDRVIRAEIRLARIQALRLRGCKHFTQEDVELCLRDIN